VERGRRRRQIWSFFGVAALALTLLATAALPGSGQTGSSLAQTHYAVFRNPQDTYLDEWFPNANWSETIWLLLREDNQQMPLLRFDIEGTLPRGARIYWARLHLYVPPDLPSANFREPCRFAAYCVLKPWVLGEATWNRASNTLSWSEAGCSKDGRGDDRCLDYSDVSETEGLGNWVIINVGPIVQEWVDGANNGLILRGYRPDAGGKAAFYSSNFRNTALRPWLEVDYGDPSTPTPTATHTATRTATPTHTLTPTMTPTSTVAPTDTLAATPTSTATRTPMHTPTVILFRVYLPILKQDHS